MLLPVYAIILYPIIPKGYAVLIANAMVLIAMLYVLLRFVLALDKKMPWPFQFSLRSLLLFTVVVALSVSWLGSEMRWANKQKEAIEALHKINDIQAMVAERCSTYGTVTYTQSYYEDLGRSWSRKPAAPRWLEKVLGTEFFDTVDIVTLVGPKVTDIDLENVKSRRNLRILRLENTNVTEAGIEKLQKALPNLFISRISIN